MILAGIVAVVVGFAIGYSYCEMIDRIERLLDD